MPYSVKEIFRTIQGEGAHAGRVAVFCRFAGCNLWSGREEDRATAICRFCDTDFVGGEKFAAAEELAARIEAEWGETLRARMVVVTGGEPTLQYDRALAYELRRRHFYVAIETNGTNVIDVPTDWICVSPKAGASLRQLEADELKVVFPQPGLDPATIAIDARIRSIQPMDGAERETNTAAAIAYCMAHPHWRLSVQTHKMVGIR